ncbi:hypothetical protein K8R61_02750 [bacterium]|nr:hypothetical protein [bacterium]
MEKGKWFFVYTINTSGFNSIGDNIDITKKVKIRLYPINKEDAKRQAKIIWKETSFENIPHEFRSTIEKDDDIEFSNPSILYEGESIEFELN